MRTLPVAGGAAPAAAPLRLTDGDLAALLAALVDDGYEVIGPTVRDGAIVYDRLDGAHDLPRGWGDEQEAGRYRLRRRGDEARFGYAVGPHSWKGWLFPPEERLWRARRTAGGELEVEPGQPGPVRRAFVGVRACELAAIEVQDRTFLGGPHPDPLYRARREGAFLLAVACGEPAGTCFCASMGTGPAPRRGFDIVLTELIEGGRPAYVARAGSARGAALLARLPAAPAAASDLEAADEVVERARTRMGRSLETGDLPGLLRENPEHARWDDVARRCLTCGNCALSCPTCFCHAVEDATDLTGQHAERWRRWDTCFSQELTYLHGGSVRASARSRYRQWLTHKLDTWHDQFGTSGCVGCGRCITWCPVGIDITAEVRAIREGEGGGARADD